MNTATPSALLSTGTFSLYSATSAPQPITTPFGYPVSCWTAWQFSSEIMSSPSTSVNYLATSTAPPSCQPDPHNIFADNITVVSSPTRTGTAVETAAYSLPHLSPGVCPVGHTIAAPLSYLAVISSMTYLQPNYYQSDYPTPSDGGLVSDLTWTSYASSTTTATHTRTVAHCCRV
jgi:hypothetical protein